MDDFDDDLPAENHSGKPTHLPVTRALSSSEKRELDSQLLDPQVVQKAHSDSPSLFEFLALPLTIMLVLLPLSWWKFTTPSITEPTNVPRTNGSLHQSELKKLVDEGQFSEAKKRFERILRNRDRKQDFSAALRSVRDRIWGQYFKALYALDEPRKVYEISREYNRKTKGDPNLFMNFNTLISAKKLMKESSSTTNENQAFGTDFREMAQIGERSLNTLSSPDFETPNKSLKEFRFKKLTAFYSYHSWKESGYPFGQSSGSRYLTRALGMMESLRTDSRFEDMYQRRVEAINFHEHLLERILEKWPLSLASSTEISLDTKSLTKNDIQNVLKEVRTVKKLHGENLSWN